MAVRGKYSSVSDVDHPVDASMGLVFRLNTLWMLADKKALSGDLDGWNFVLDRIYCNLLYRNPLEADLSPDGKEIVKLRLNEEADRIYRKFRDIVVAHKNKLYNAMKKRNRILFKQEKEDLYRTLMLKDVWLRKFMQELKLYLKEIEFNPASAMFGGGSVGRV